MILNVIKHWHLYDYIIFLNVNKFYKINMLGNSTLHVLTGDHPMTVPDLPRSRWFIPVTPSYTCTMYIIVWVVCVYEQCIWTRHVYVHMYMDWPTINLMAAGSPHLNFRGLGNYSNTRTFAWVCPIGNPQKNPVIFWCFAWQKLKQIGINGVSLYTPMHSWSFGFFCRSFLLRFLLPIQDGQRRTVIPWPDWTCHNSADFYSSFGMFLGTFPIKNGQSHCHFGRWSERFKSHHLESLFFSAAWCCCKPTWFKRVVVWFWCGHDYPMNQYPKWLMNVYGGVFPVYPCWIMLIHFGYFWILVESGRGYSYNCLRDLCWTVVATLPYVSPCPARNQMTAPGCFKYIGSIRISV